MAITKKPWFWPAFIVVLLGGMLAVNVVMFFVAGSDPSFAVEKNYYEKALAWDQKRAQDVVDEELGWNIGLAFARGDTGEKVAATLSDRAGGPVTGAMVKATAFHLARSAMELSGDFHEGAPGVYEAVMSMKRPGLWEFRFQVEAAGKTYTQTIRRDWTR